MTLFKWLASNIFHLLGGLSIGFGLPIGEPILFDGDFVLLLPLGVLLIGISYYNIFIDTSWRDE
jgi:hypothetical protein